MKVTFIDDASGQAIAVADLEPGQLPESFLEPTSLELAGSDWSVVAADPPTRAEYVARQALTLRLRRLEHVDPKDLLFSLPTICDQLPIDDGALDGSEQILAEDDWRQVELIAASLRPIVAEELAAVRDIYEHKRQGAGFTAIHVRSHLPEPLAAVQLPLSALEAWGPAGALAFRDHAAPIAGGFAGPELAFYGQADRGALVALGFGPSPAPLAAQVEALARRAGLVVVDWCGCRVAAPGDADFHRTLTGIDEGVT